MTTHPQTDPDFAFEPVPGLPALLPAGEHVLWRGSPEPWAFTWDVMRLRAVGIVCLGVLAWRIGAGVHDGLSFGTITVSALWTIGLIGLLLGVLVTAGQLMARGTIYTVTNRRLVIRHGVAMPMAINIPFAKVEGAAVSKLAHGCGTVALQMDRTSRASFVALWPHARPFWFLRPEPVIRAVADVEPLARIVADALGAHVRSAPPATRTKPATPVSMPTMGAASTS
jgi:hypothetical protein